MTNKYQTVTLDVGGTVYRTARDTLSESSYLVNLVDDIWTKGNGNNNNETIFIDRDGFLFRYILLYLRTGEINIEHHHLKSLLCEAQFYLISKLTNRIEIALNKTEIKGKKEPEKVYQLLDERELVNLSNIDTISEYGNIYRNREAKSMKYEFITTVKCMKNVFNCPRDIPVHDRFGKCGKACEEARPEGFQQYILKETVLYLVSYLE